LPQNRLPARPLVNPVTYKSMIPLTTPVSEAAIRALKLGEAAKVAPIDKLSVVLVAIFGVIFLGERLTAPNWLGIALIAVGAILVAYR
jgi:uncharacterized membrane protein